MWLPGWRAREWLTVDEDSATETAVEGGGEFEEDVVEELGLDTSAGLTPFLVMLRAVGLPTVIEPDRLSGDGLLLVLPIPGIWNRMGGAKCFCSI
jgi:hypothetical protein